MRENKVSKVITNLDYAIIFQVGGGQGGRLKVNLGYGTSQVIATLIC